MSITEEETELREMMNNTEEEIIAKTNWPRCSRCKRQTFGHEPGKGSNCKMDE